MAQVYSNLKKEFKGRIKFCWKEDSDTQQVLRDLALTEIKIEFGFFERFFLSNKEKEKIVEGYVKNTSKKDRQHLVVEEVNRRDIESIWNIRFEKIRTVTNHVAYQDIVLRYYNLYFKNKHISECYSIVGLFWDYIWYTSDLGYRGTMLSKPSKKHHSIINTLTWEIVLTNFCDLYIKNKEITIKAQKRGVDSLLSPKELLIEAKVKTKDLDITFKQLQRKINNKLHKKIQKKEP